MKLKKNAKTEKIYKKNEREREGSRFERKNRKIQKQQNYANLHLQYSIIMPGILVYQ